MVPAQVKTGAPAPTQRENNTYSNFQRRHSTCNTASGKRKPQMTNTSSRKGQKLSRETTKLEHLYIGNNGPKPQPLQPVGGVRKFSRKLKNYIAFKGLKASQHKNLQNQS